MRWWVALLVLAGCSHTPPVKQARRTVTPNPDATWPWPHASHGSLLRGMEHWTATGSDGSRLMLLEFDFRADPRLRFSLYDQAHDTQPPWAGKTDFFPHSVAEIAARRPKGSVVFACNGMFFAFDRGPGSPNQGWGTHIGPSVVNGVARYNVGSPRWAFGVKDGRFKTLLSPSAAQMAHEFDFAAIGAQCLVRDGHPLKLWPEPKPGDPPLTKVPPTQPDEVGHVREVDYWKTSRVSFGWPTDSSKLWVLVVLEPDNEVESKLNARGVRSTRDGGWTLADLQRFWVKHGAANAVNSDGGIVTQYVLRTPNGCLFQPSQWSGNPAPQNLPTDLSGARSGGGTLMYWMVSRVDR